MTNEDTLREMLNKKERENERLLMRVFELCSDNANLKKENEELIKKATESEDAAMITRKISDGIKANWVLYFDTWEQCELWCNRHNL